MTNDKGINKYDLCDYLPNNIIKKMFEELNDSNKDGNEQGFFICSNAKNMKDMNNENTITTERVIGSKESVDKEESKCPKDLQRIGNFHTHPPFKNIILKDYYIKTYGIDAEQKILGNPSVGDMWYAINNAFEFSCIGAKDGIKCFSTNNKEKIHEDRNKYILRQKREWRKDQGTIKKPKYRERMIKFDEWHARELEKRHMFCEMKSDK